jgi:hypothetical protein
MIVQLDLTTKKKDIARQRWEMETSGVEHDGMIFPTDRESVQILDSTMEKIRRGLIPFTDWKCKNGWYQLNSQNIDALEVKILTHIQNAFQWEKNSVNIKKGDK